MHLNRMSSVVKGDNIINVKHRSEINFFPSLRAYPMWAKHEQGARNKEGQQGRVVDDDDEADRENGQDVADDHGTGGRVRRERGKGGKGKRKGGDRNMKGRKGVWSQPNEI
jgi:hypothetical protein